MLTLFNDIKNIKKYIFNSITANVVVEKLISKNIPYYVISFDDTHAKYIYFDFFLKILFLHSVKINENDSKMTRDPLTYKEAVNVIYYALNTDAKINTDINYPIILIGEHNKKSNDEKLNSEKFTNNDFKELTKLVNKCKLDPKFWQVD